MQQPSKERRSIKRRCISQRVESIFVSLKGVHPIVIRNSPGLRSPDSIQRICDLLREEGIGIRIVDNKESVSGRPSAAEGVLHAATDSSHIANVRGFNSSITVTGEVILKAILIILGGIFQSNIILISQDILNLSKWILKGCSYKAKSIKKIRNRFILRD